LLVSSRPALLQIHHRYRWGGRPLRKSRSNIAKTSSGEVHGTSIKISGKWDAYLATPDPGKAHAGAGILYLPDVIGIWENSKLMADQFAANGYLCLIIDQFNGDPLELNRPEGFDFPSWLTQGSDGNNPHTAEHVDPIVEAAIKTLKEEYGVTKLGAAGYCFGAKVSARLPDGFGRS
jgi:dienelactone hydrolase